MRMYFRSIRIDNTHQIARHTDSNFILLIQHALLLGLKDADRLNEMQHRQAEATLLEQHRENISAHAESLSDD